MDFWAQHKDLVLRVLAGVGVFLVALIARGIVYGDDLQTELATNRRTVAEVRQMKLLDPVQEIPALEQRAEKLEANVREIARQIGRDAGAADLETVLIEGALATLRDYAGERRGQLPSAAAGHREALRADLNGGFGNLRLEVSDKLADEAGELNIRMDGGIGFENVQAIEPQEVVKYLLQLELVARVLRYALDARVNAIEEVHIEERDVPAIPHRNPAFLREYVVRVALRASQEAAARILDRLETEPPRVPVRVWKQARAERPRDHVVVEMELVAAAVNPAANLAPTKE
ncbi:MAG: hypothetical protein ACREID_06135 [Planctomycetota bacterium]